MHMDLTKRLNVMFPRSVTFSPVTHKTFSFITIVFHLADNVYNLGNGFYYCKIYFLDLPHINSVYHFLLLVTQSLNYVFG